MLENIKLGRVTIVNAYDRDVWDNNYIIALGAYGNTLLRIYEDSLDRAIDIAVDWVVDNAPGLLADSEVQDEYERLLAEGLEEESAMKQAEADTIQAGSVFPPTRRPKPPQPPESMRHRASPLNLPAPPRRPAPAAAQPAVQGCAPKSAYSSAENLPRKPSCP